MKAKRLFSHFYLPLDCCIIVYVTLCFSCCQVTSLLDKSKKQEYVEDIREDYEDIRDDHYDSLKVRLTIECA